MTYDLVDIGANLTHDSFDADREAVVERAREKGVNTFIVTGADIAGSRKGLLLARANPGRMFATAGVHPHHAKDLDDAGLTVLDELLQEDEVVSAGECGLDFFRNFSPREDQERAFEAQLDLATAHRKPVFLHQRDAHEDFVRILRTRRDRLTRAVAHCFTGDENELRAYLDMDLYIGITGWICDERRGHHLKELVHAIPADRIMIETDAPYLLPRDLSPKPKTRRNEPMHLAHILEEVARCRDQDPLELGAVTTRNARRFFGLDG